MRHNTLSSDPFGIQVFRRETGHYGEKYVCLGYLVAYDNDIFIDYYNFGTGTVSKYMIGYSTYIYHDNQFIRLQPAEPPFLKNT